MKCALALVVLAGCFGGGTTIAGTWRPAHVVDETVIIQDAEQPEKTIEIAHDEPERTSGGLMVSLVNPGVLFVREADGIHAGMAINSYAEYTRSRGAFALGMRLGGNLASGFGGEALDIPVDLVAHVGTGAGTRGSAPATRRISRSGRRLRMVRARPSTLGRA